jgi:hypothetical protein
MVLSNILLLDEDRGGSAWGSPIPSDDNEWETVSEGGLM